MTRNSGPSPMCPTCACQFGTGDCLGFVEVDGSWQPHFILDDADSQLAEDGPAGFGVFAPPWVIDPPAVHVYSSVNDTIPYNATYPLLFNEELYDTDSMHEKQDKSSRLVCKTDGLYMVTFNIRFDKTDGVGDVAAFIRKNGSAEFIAVDGMPIADPDLYCTFSLSRPSNLVVGDYLEVLLRQDLVLDDVGTSLTALAEYGMPHFAATLLRLAP